MNDRIRELAEGYIEDELSEIQLAELERLLAVDESARLDFLAFLEVHAGLAWETRGREPSEKTAPAVRTIPFRRQTLAIAAMAAVLAIAAFILFRRDDPEPAAIAVVNASFHGQWADGREASAGNPLGAGLWELQSGLVELETVSGTTLLLEGPASLRLDDALHAKLVSGNLVVRMPKGKSGFVVDMPAMKVTDLGTEFGVSVTADGASRVQVYDGKVRAESDGSRGKELTAGETVLCSIDGRMTPGPFNEDRFIRTFPPASPGFQIGGPLYNRSGLSSVDVLPARTSVTTDGDLSEWNAATAFRSACEPPYDRTYFVEGMMMYDAENLYLAANVGDPLPMKNAARPGVEFAGGSVIVRISADRKLGWPLKGTNDNARSSSPTADSLNERISHLIMWHDAKSGRARIQIVHGFDSRRTEIDPRGWSGMFVKHPDGLGYTLEYKIPWTLLNCADDPPRAGDRLAGLWMAHWSDEEGRVCRGQWVDVTNHDPAATARIAPYVFFQHGPCWGKVNYLPLSE